MNKKRLGRGERMDDDRGRLAGVQDQIQFNKQLFRP